MKLYSSNAILSPLAQAIFDTNLDFLENEVRTGWDVNQIFTITGWIEETPLFYALYLNNKKIVKWLIAQNANLNDSQSPAIPAACVNGNVEIIELLLNRGANINISDRVGKTAMSVILYAERYDLIPFLLENGYNLKKDGISLRQAVSNRQKQAVQYFLKIGIDVNYHTKNMVFPYNTTAVAEATRNNDIEMVKLLVQHGADVKIKDTYGERPYNIAVKNKNQELISYLKDLEPIDWHNAELKLEELQRKKVSKQLINLLQSNDIVRTVEISNNESVSYVKFNKLVDISKIDWRGNSFFDLLLDVDNYSAEGFLVWDIKTKSLAFADYEHSEYTILGTWKEFINNPNDIISKII